MSHGVLSGLQETVLSGSLILAALVALLAGLVSFFTPCSLPLLPGYLSYVAGVAGAESSVTRELRGETVGNKPRVVAGSVLFVLGFAAVFTSYGALLGAVGSQLTRHQDVVIKVAGAITIVMGLVFATAGRRIPLLGRTARPALRPRVGLTGAPLLGIVFGIGWTPCIGPTLAAVLALSTSAATAGRGAVLAFVYSLGLGLPFVLCALSVRRAIDRLHWFRRHGSLVSLLGGLGLVLLGILQLTGAWSTALTAVQRLVANWAAPL